MRKREHLPLGFSIVWTTYLDSPSTPPVPTQRTPAVNEKLLLQQLGQCSAIVNRQLVICGMVMVSGRLRHIRTCRYGDVGAAFCDDGKPKSLSSQMLEVSLHCKEAGRSELIVTKKLPGVLLL